jgi:hypothetical protein
MHFLCKILKSACIRGFMTHGIKTINSTNPHLLESWNLCRDIYHFQEAVTMIFTGCGFSVVGISRSFKQY